MKKGKQKHFSHSLGIRRPRDERVCIMVLPLSISVCAVEYGQNGGKYGFGRNEPQIIPDIAFQTVDGKCIVIVEIYPGANRPYFLKSAGKENGTYVRIGGTSRLADRIKIRELEIEGENLSWDELVCVGYPVEERAVKKLCEDIHSYMLRAASGDEKAEIPEVTRQQLVNWKILKMSEGEVMATNGFVFLTSDYFRFARIQCGLFKGDDRDEFIDKKEFSGPLYEQIEEAYQFVLRHQCHLVKIKKQELL